MKKLSLIFITFLFSLGCLEVTKNKIKTKEKIKVHIAVLDSGDASQHQQKVVALLESRIKCDVCVIESFPIYEPDGKLYVEKMVEKLIKVKNHDLIHLSWNMRSNEQTKPIEDALKQIINNGKIVVGALGALSTSKGIVTAPETVLGRVGKILLVGEKSQSEDVEFESTRAPGVFALAETPFPYEGSSFSSVIVTAWVAETLSKGKENSKSFRMKLWKIRNSFEKPYVSFSEIQKKYEK